MLGTVAPVWLAVVRRGQQAVFDQLQKLEEGGLVSVTWDRRQADRRKSDTGIAPTPAPDDQRRNERRVNTPPVWFSLGFLLVPHPEDAGGRNGSPDSPGLAPAPAAVQFSI